MMKSEDVIKALNTGYLLHLAEKLGYELTGDPVEDTIAIHEALIRINYIVDTMPDPANIKFTLPEDK